MFCAGDDFLLQFAGQIAEVIAVAGHADDQVAVRSGFGLGLAQRFGPDHVELDVMAVQLEVARGPGAPAWSMPFSSANSAGVNFMFSNVPPVLRWSILAADLMTAVGPLPIGALHRRNSFGQRQAGLCVRRAWPR